MRKLQIAFSKREKAKKLLANLEELKVKKEIEEERYGLMKEEYERLRKEGELELEAIRDELTRELEASRKELEVYQEELKNLELRIKVGELSADRFIKQEKRTRGKAKRLEQQIENLEELLKAEASEDVGGFVDVPVKGRARAQRFRRR